jgi:hypothetical protein
VLLSGNVSTSCLQWSTRQQEVKCCVQISNWPPNISSIALGALLVTHDQVRIGRNERRAKRIVRLCWGCATQPAWPQQAKCVVDRDGYSIIISKFTLRSERLQCTGEVLLHSKRSRKVVRGAAAPLLRHTHTHSALSRIIGQICDLAWCYILFIFDNSYKHLLLKHNMKPRHVSDQPTLATRQRYDAYPTAKKLLKTQPT